MPELQELVRISLGTDAAALDASVTWAAGHLKEVCRSRGLQTADEGEAAQPVPQDRTVAIRICGTAAGDELSDGAAGAVNPQTGPDSFALYRRLEGSMQVIHAVGSDARGLTYAVLELADRIRYAQDPLSELRGLAACVEKPASPVRSINRLFVSEAEDKPWFYDQGFWRDYLTELATHRFNRLHLALGMGYDYGHDPGVQDNYFCFAYPFLMTQPDYGVSVQGLPAGEAERNLEALRFIGGECKRRGIHFQLGLWNHAYDPSESPNARYIIEGMTPELHAAYCRDSLRTLLQACPGIDGITLRTHYEGGIPEPAEAFWDEVFAGIASCGRRVEVDLHAKGLDDDRLQAALDHGLPVVVSPKYWAEHMGPPYHQAAIRTQELPVERTDRADLMSITATYRRFTRYGYGDFLKEERPYGVLFRLWPGTQRVLLWGDPAMAAGYGRLGTFCGSLGVELCEPLSFKGRKGSGTAGGRELYADPALRMDGAEWKKYVYSYRLWGRLLYNPDADPSAWRRYLQAEFGGAAEACEQGLAHASRILPLLTAAHLPSAANNVFWPEMYANMPIVPQSGPTPYDFDTPKPGTFGAVSPADPAMFYGIDEYADALIRGSRSGKLSPLEVADRLDRMADQAERCMQEAGARIRDAEAPVFRRWAVDVEAQAALGRFFAAKLRAGTAYALFERTSAPDELDRAIGSYRQAKEAWLRLSALTRGVYKDDLTFGFVPYMRGHWAARFSGVEADLAAMELQRADLPASGGPAYAAEPAAGLLPPAAVQAPGPDLRPGLLHTPPDGFVPGAALKLEAVLTGPAAPVTVVVHYRRVNQAEAYRQTTAQGSADGVFTAAIPASYTDTPYPLLYFYEISDAEGQARQVPGFDDTLSNQPYYVIGRMTRS